MEAQPALKTLGKFELAVGDCIAGPLPTHKARALVAFLVTNRGRDISRERLLELFWREFEPQRAREGLRTALSSIRQALRSTQNDPGAILITNKSVVQWIDSTDFDAERFVELTERTDLASLEAALQLYGGDFLEGGYEEWAVGERERLANAYEKALAKIVAIGGDAQTARRLLERNPYSEDAYATLIETELAGGRPAAAGELLKRYRAAMGQIGSEISAPFEERFAGVADLSAGESEIAVPFVARTEELQQFERAFHELGKKGFVELVVGEPGIGKTALLARANEKAREAGLRSLTVRGSDDPRRLGSWRSLYQRLTGRDLDQLAGGATEIANAAAHEMVEAFGKPTVLFVDDAQALSGDSFATFAQIVRIAERAGHAVVAATRPEARERIEIALSGSPYEVAALRPLERADVGAAIALTVDSSTPEFVDAIYERSGGHPLFLVSLLQSLVQGETLRRERGRWRVVRPLGEHLDLPRDLRTSIETRLHAAGEDAAVVACALALEPSATALELAEALEYAEPRVLDALDELIRYGLIREGNERAQFDFVHDLLREVSVSILNPGRRVALHRAFARRFERSDVPEGSLRLARHLRAAGLAIPAVHAYLKAAQTALARQAFHDALECCAEGAHTIERAEANDEIRKILSALARVRAEAATSLGETTLALDAAEEAVRQSRVSGQDAEIAVALIARSSIYGMLANPAAQLTGAFEAAEIARTTDEPLVRARALIQAAAAMLANGAASESIQFAQEACSLAKEHDDFATLWPAYAQLLKTQLCQWRFDSAATALEEALPVAERAGRPARAELHCIQVAYDYLTDDLASAAEHARSAISSEPTPLTLFTGHYLQGVLARARRDWNEILEAVAHCKALESIAKLPPCVAAITMLEADALLERNAPGDVEAASTAAQGLSAPPAANGIIGWSDCIQLTRACVAAHLSAPEARAALRTALDALEENACRLPLDCDRAFARLAAAAQEAAEFTIRDRAAERSAYYRAIRTASTAKMSVPSIPVVSY
jgi:DNA-binding SARP family transcriptional activator